MESLVERCPQITFYVYVHVCICTGLNGVNYWDLKLCPHIHTHVHIHVCTYMYVHAPVSEWCDDKTARVSQVLIAIVEESVSLSNGTVILLLHTCTYMYVSSELTTTCITYMVKITTPMYMVHIYTCTCTTHSLTHSLTHLPTNPLTHSLTHSLTHPLTHSLTHSPTHPITHSPTHSPNHSLTHPLTHSLTQ